MIINTKCVCVEVGRELSYMRVDPECFQHGTEVPQEILDNLSDYGKALYKRYRAPYFSTVEKEARWWANHFGLPITP